MSRPGRAGLLRRMIKYGGLAVRSAREHGIAQATLNFLSEITFDLKHGTTTWVPTEVTPGCPTLEESSSDAVHYQGVNPRLMRRVLERLPRESQLATFVDYGCGKGRALLLAMSAGYRNVVGIEFDKNVAAAARYNLDRVRGQRSRASADVLVMDAAEYALPVGPVVAFLYNPFRGGTLRRVAARLRQHAEEFPVWVAYVNPVSLELFRAEGFRERETWKHRRGLAATILAIPRHKGADDARPGEGISTRGRQPNRPETSGWRSPSRDG